MDPGASVGQFLRALHQRRRQNRINHLQYLVTVRSIEHDVAFVLCAHRALGNGHRCSRQPALRCVVCAAGVLIGQLLLQIDRRPRGLLGFLAVSAQPPGQLQVALAAARAGAVVLVDSTLVR